MIKKVEMFTVVCDNCGARCGENDGIIAWSDESTTKDVASNSDWANEGDKHYCPDCFSYGDEDELILNLERKR
jgi:hypothetical protein